MKKWKKWIATVLIVLFLLPVISTDADAAMTGTWKKAASGKWWYSYPDGSYAKSAWLQEGSKWYYFDAKGYMVTGWKQIGGKWYYFGTNGAMVTGWKQIGGKWYFFPKGVMANGWKQISGKWYYFDDGAMVTGKQTIKGVVYIFDSNGVYQSTQSKVGTTIKFGKYEQDNKTSNGKEDIEWIVLDEKSDGSLLVISKYALDRYSYDSDYKAVTWEKSKIRTWLNGTFMSNAFSSTEKAKILTTSLTNKDNPYTGTDGGNDTKDQVFLLSLDEAQKYFGKNTVTKQGYTINANAACKPTAYAKSKNAMTYDFSSSYYSSEMKQFTGCCWYWLRTPGSESRRALYVNNVGEAGYASFYCYNTDCAVRPAMVIKP